MTVIIWQIRLISLMWKVLIHENKKRKKTLDKFIKVKYW